MAVDSLTDRIEADSESYGLDRSLRQRLQGSGLALSGWSMQNL
ncbi:hypothetical protein C4K23_3394 [Pseudomonas chlororaphis]|nr:hypothetical protein C4K23_3394 [Pseudomonas chlororaphis]